MAANPLEDDPQREHRIRDRAYHLWIDHGRPHGREGEFWERARELVGIEESAGAAQLPNPQADGQDPLREEPIEEAFLQENLGSFPDHLTDQGEVQSTPRRASSAKAKAKAPEPVAPKLAKKQAVPAPEKLPAKPSLKAKVLKAAETVIEKAAETPKKRKPKA